MAGTIKTNNFEIKENEMMFFIDFNKTLVSYDDMLTRAHSMCFGAFNSSKPVVSMRQLISSLENFENKTGLTPVICVVTNEIGRAHV